MTQPATPAWPQSHRLSAASISSHGTRLQTTIRSGLGRVTGRTHALYRFQDWCDPLAVTFGRPKADRGHLSPLNA
ncbi:hypothetical protein CRG98_027443 [Punica granatum]|nr:hypothetical protein CRG98_027443 [Punica granatum]